jgi:acyl-CoA synthetase (NDP forming)
MTFTATEQPAPSALREGAFGDRSTRLLLNGLGLDLDYVRSEVVEDVQQAEAFLSLTGGSAVIKFDSDKVLHKSEHGLVRLGVDADSVTTEYTALKASAESMGMRNGAVVMQPMARAGLDLFIGVSRDETLGLVIMIGLGGVTVELFKDVSQLLAPIDRDQARQMLTSLNSYPLMSGWRGSETHSTERLEALLVQISQLLSQCDDLVELDLNPIRLYPDGSYLVLDSRSSWQQATLTSENAPRSHPANLNKLFSPTSIAVVGASRDSRRPGGRLVRALVAGGYQGAIYPVSPHGGEIEGLAVHADLDLLPVTPDLVCLAVSAEIAEPIVAQCARLGVPAILLLASGYAESGDAGAAREAALRAALGGSETVLCGPNTIGLVNPSSKVLATFSQGMTALPKRDSGVCVIAQSGAVAGSLVSREVARGYGIGSWVTVGNQVDLDVADYIDHYIDQDSTRSIALFLEGVRDGRRLRAALARARVKGIPVAGFKTGLTEVGSRAVSAHSGALAGNGEAYRALFEQESVAQVEELTALLEVSWVLGHVAPPSAPGVAVLTTSGGAGSATADIVAQSGLELARLAHHTQQALAAALPPIAHAANPLDITAEGAFIPDTFDKTIRALQDDSAVGVVLVVLTSIGGDDAIRVAEEIASASRASETPILVTWLVDPSLAQDGLNRLVNAGIRVFDEPARMVGAARHLVQRSFSRRSS